MKGFIYFWFRGRLILIFISCTLFGLTRLWDSIGMWNVVEALIGSPNDCRSAYLSFNKAKLTLWSSMRSNLKLKLHDMVQSSNPLLKLYTVVLASYKIVQLLFLSNICIKPILGNQTCYLYNGSIWKLEEFVLYEIYA